MREITIVLSPEGLYLVVERTPENTMKTLCARWTMHDALMAAAIWLRRN